MTTHLDAQPSAEPARTAGRAVTTALVLAFSAGLAWTGGMIYTVIVWAS
ncbi:morphogenic membrane protein MmpA [Streptomyces sp. NPDC059618]